MKQHYTTYFLFLLAISLWLGSTCHTVASPHFEAPQIGYLQNKGQWHANVLHRAKTSGLDIYTEHQGFTFVFYDPARLDAAAHAHCQQNDPKNRCNHNHATFTQPINDRVTLHAVKVHFVGSNPKPHIEEQDILPERHNFFLGNDPQKWATDIHPAKTLWHKGVYPGTDLKIYSTGSHLKYDWIVSPGANPAHIKLAYTGQSDLCVKDGHLFISTVTSEAVELSPYAYQVINGKNITVNCRYTIKNNQVGFEFPDGYNQSLPLVIDPVLVASSYSGSTSTVYGHSATYGQNDEIFGSGRAFGTGYPVTTGAYDVSFNGNTDATVSKLSADGTTLIYASYIGGSESDLTCNLITNYNNEIIVLVSTNSTNYPTTAGCIDNTLGGTADFGITILSANGNALIGSTYLGGSGNEGQANSVGWGGITYGLLGELMIDEFNNIYLAGYTGSTNFPTTPGAFQTTYGGGDWDGMVVKMTPNLSSLIWSTFLGGNANDLALGIRIAPDGSVFVCGGTASSNFPVTAGAYQTTPLTGTAGSNSPDGFVTHLNAAGTVNIASTFVNTNQSDIAFFIDFDRDDNVCLYGLTDGNFTVTPGTYSNANGKMFLMSLNPALNTLLYSTRIGVASMSINPTAFLVDNCNRIYAGGFTSNSGMPTTPDAWSQVNGSGDFYFIVLEANATGLLYGTYFGSPSGSEHVDGGTCRYNDRGVVYQAVCTSATNFPTTPTAYSPTKLSTSWDLVVFKYDFEQAGVLANATASPSAVGCVPYTVNFSNLSVDALNYFWDFKDGNTSTDASPVHTFTTSGLYEVMMIAINPTSCNYADTTLLNVLVVDPASSTADFTYTQNTDCDIYQFDFQTDLNGLVHFWNFGDGATNTQQNPTHIYANPGTYTVMLVVSSTLGCFAPDTTYQTISFTAEAVIALTNNLITECAPLTFTFDNNSLNATTYSWNFGDGSPLSSEVTPTHTFPNPGFYNVVLIASNPLACNLADTATVTLTVLPSTPLTANFTEILPGICDPYTVQFNAATASNITNYEWDFGDGATGTGSSVSHTYASAGVYSVSLTVSNPTGICILANTFTNTITLPQGNLIAAEFVPPSGGCAPHTINLSANNTGATTYTWLWGSGNASAQGQNANFTYDTPGAYQISLIAANPSACNLADTITATIEVYALPKAGFEAPAFILVGEFTQLTNTSLDATTYEWDFGNGESSSEINPMVKYNAVGQYNVCLDVLSANNCPDVFCLPIVVQDNAKLGVPNAFTPNNDNVNDILYVEGRSNIQTMEFAIYNRWGKLLFYTNNPNEGWDGFYQGELQENEVYVYNLTATLLSGEVITRSGNIALLR